MQADNAAIKCESDGHRCICGWPDRPCIARTPDAAPVCLCSSVDDSDGSAAACDNPDCPIHGWDATQAQLDVEEFEGGYPWPNI